MLEASILQLLGNNPIGFVDIGARGGVHPLIDPIAKATAVLGFEPDQVECVRMRADLELNNRFASVNIDDVALADKIGPATLHNIIAPTNTSLRPTNPVFVSRYDMVKWHEVGQAEINTVTLDHVIFEKRNGEGMWGEALKVDTQGTEHEILLGARKTLEERTLFACIEVSFCELYVGQSLFSEVELMMREIGFSFYAFNQTSCRSRKTLDKRHYSGRERLFQADAFFFRDPFDPFNTDRTYSNRELAILATFATLTGFHDFALELLDRLGPEGDHARAAVIERALLTADSSRSAVRDLYQAVKERPDDANILVGKFVDNRREDNDYRDVILPNTYLRRKTQRS